MQEHRPSKRKYKYHDTGNKWTFFYLGICMEISAKPAIGGEGMRIGPRTLKSINSLEKMKPTTMVATFNNNPSTTIISCYSSINVSNFSNDLSALVHSIPKHDVLMIGRDMNAQIGKNINNKFSLYNSSNRIGEHLADFTKENRLTDLILNFIKERKTMDLHLRKKR